MTASISRPFATFLAALMVATLWLPTLDMPSLAASSAQTAAVA